MSLPFPAITSRRHPLVQACRDARAGGAGQPLLLDGWHLVQEARSAGLDVDAVAVAAEPLEPADRAVLDALADAGAQVVRVTADVLQAMSPVRTPSGIVALARRPTHAVDDVFAPPPALVVAAVDVQDPGNVGALVRTAEALGASGLLAVGTTADPFAWKALRASMGSAFRLPIVRLATAGEAMAAAKDRGVQVIALAPRGGTAPNEVDLGRPTCLLLGGEGPGLPEALVRDADRAVSLPMAAPVESLNVAVAGALALYEAAGRRARTR
ncbi:MAG: RNA methyltransferase [Vicinamibacterales bacterium]